MLIRRLIARQARNISTPNVRISRRFLATESSDGITSLSNPAEASLAVTEENDALAALERTIHPEAKANYDEVAAAFAARQQLNQLSGALGSQLETTFRTRDFIHDPPSAAEVTLELLLATQAHLGHHTSRWDPGNSKYIFGIRDGTHIISLETTAAHLRRAARVVELVAARAGVVLFVGTRKGQIPAVVAAAKRTGGCHLFSRWVPGSLSNAEKLLGSCKQKVVNELDEEVPEFNEQLYKRAAAKPDLVVCLNPKENYVLLRECALNNIPTIGIMDTNVDPSWVTYAIPANDDSIKCVQLIAGALGRAGEAGRNTRLRYAQRGVITYSPAAGLVKLRYAKPEGDEGAEEDELIPDKDVRPGEVAS